MGRRIDLAVRWNQAKIMRRAFQHFRSYTNGEISLRKMARKASIQQKVVQRHLEQIESAALMDNAGAGRVPGTLLAKQKQAQQYEEARRRRQKVQADQDRGILLQQRARRRQRVENERRERDQSFAADWAEKKLEVESACLERNKSWLQSSDFKNQSQKRQREIKRYLSIKEASTSDTEREDAITSQAVISYSILDAHMANAGIVPGDVFRRLGDVSTPINYVPFQASLVSCGLVLKASEFEELFAGIAQYKQPKPTDQSVGLDDLRELRSLSSHIGQEGTRWKMYVDPIHQQLLMHNVVSGKKIYERNIKRKHIKQMVSDNVQDVELLKVRRKHSEERRNAHRSMIEHYAAKSIQSMYYQWKGGQQIKTQRWVVERRALFRRRAKEAAAAMLIQTRFRACRDKK